MLSEALTFIECCRECLHSDNRQATTAEWPCSAARCSAVRPFLSRKLTSSWTGNKASRALTMPKWPC
eukprot:scaffold51410_cov36-Prasinocladus_malaysianus.AAC.3